MRKSDAVCIIGVSARARLLANKLLEVLQQNLGGEGQGADEVWKSSSRTCVWGGGADSRSKRCAVPTAYRVLLLEAVAVGPHGQVAVQCGHCADRPAEV